MKHGKLAKQCGYTLQIQVLQSGGGFYIGTISDEGEPISRESIEYFKDKESAERAMENGLWTQREES